MITYIIDKSEKLPYPLEPSITKKLKTADYSAVGYEDIVGVERKSLDDYIKSLIGDRERFEKEWKRLQEFKYKLVLVEASIEDIFKLQNYEIILGSTLSLILHYNIPVFFAEDRQKAIKVTEKFIQMGCKDDDRKDASESVKKARKPARKYTSENYQDLL